MTPAPEMPRGEAVKPWEDRGSAVGDMLNKLTHHGLCGDQEREAARMEWHALRGRVQTLEAALLHAYYRTHQQSVGCDGCVNVSTTVAAIEKARGEAVP